MDLARSTYSRELKIAAMRAMDAGESGVQVARRMEVSPKLLERWRAEWRARGEQAFPARATVRAANGPATRSVWRSWSARSAR